MSAIVPPTVTDRMLAAFRALVRAEDPNRTYRGIYEYRVGGVGSGTADVSPTDSSLSLPSVLRVPLRPGLLGESVMLTVGTTCLMAFVNGDPTRPMLIGADQIPARAKVDASAEIDIGPTAGVINIGNGAQHVALAELVTAQLNNIATALTTHVHTGVTTGLGTSAVAALIYTPSNVASTKVLCG